MQEVEIKRLAAYSLLLYTADGARENQYNNVSLDYSYIVKINSGTAMGYCCYAILSVQLMCARSMCSKSSSYYYYSYCAGLQPSQNE